MAQHANDVHQAATQKAQEKDDGTPRCPRERRFQEQDNTYSWNIRDWGQQDRLSWFMVPRY